MKDMNKAINHNSSHQKPIKKGVSAIHTHKMSIRKLGIKKWSRVYSLDFPLLKNNTGERNQPQRQADSDDCGSQNISQGGCASEQLRHTSGLEKHRWQGLSHCTIQSRKKG